MTDLLVVEDDTQLVKALALTLRSRGYDVTTAGTGADGTRVDTAARIRAADAAPHRGHAGLPGGKGAARRARWLRPLPAGPGLAQGLVETADFVVDLGRKEVRSSTGDVVHLTPTEWGMLEALVRADGLLVAGADLLREVWGPAYEAQTNYLRVYMAQLRRKLEPDPSHPIHLITEPGLGYRLDE